MNAAQKPTRPSPLRSRLALLGAALVLLAVFGQYFDPALMQSLGNLVWLCT